MNDVSRVNKRRENAGESRNIYHISFANECQLCFETCQKPRRLPCEHEFCKECLVDYFNKIPADDRSSSFPCPSCNRSTQKPSLSKSKWTKAFKLDKRTAFYTGDLPSTEDSHAIITGTKSGLITTAPSLDSELVSRRATTHGKPSRRESSLKRSAVHYSSPQSTDLGFNTTISTDEKECVYWGGTVLITGKLVLPDFYNNCVKVFTVYGNHVCNTKIPKRPFDLTEIHDNTIIVTHGGCDKSVTFLSYTDMDITYTGSISIEGHLYSVTRSGKDCVGIFETTEGKIKLVRINVRGRVALKDPGEVSKFLTSASHVMYNGTNERYYFTEQMSLVCVDSNFNILYSKSYPYLEDDHYKLGSITMDANGSIYVASDMCVLCMDSDGYPQYGPVPMNIDPFHIMVTPDGSKLLLVGRSNRVHIYMPPQEL